MLQNDGNTNQQASINAFLLKNTIALIPQHYYKYNFLST